MAGTFTIDLSQLNRLAVDLQRVGRVAPEKARDAIQTAAKAIKADAQANAPVLSGELRRSIGYETRETATGAIAVIGPTAYYGRFVEDGTSRMSPIPYLGPAFTRHAGSYVSALEAIAAGTIP